MRSFFAALLCLVLPLGIPAQTISSAPFNSCRDCPQKGWPVSLLAGEIRVGLASPNGEYLALVGGSGDPTKAHSVILIRSVCSPESLQTAELTRKGAYPVPPPEMPGEFVRLEWSPDSNTLFALGSTYRITAKPEGGFSAQKLRTFEEPFIDFRFGPGRYAAGIVFLKAGEQKTRADGQRGFAIHTDYRMMLLTTPRDSQIPKREKAAYFWVPREMIGEPLLSWDPDGSVLLYTPMGKVVESYKPPGKRAREKERVPQERVGVSGGPWSGPCDGTWELKVKKGQPRVRLRGQK